MKSKITFVRRGVKARAHEKRFDTHHHVDRNPVETSRMIAWDDDFYVMIGDKRPNRTPEQRQFLRRLAILWFSQLRDLVNGGNSFISD